jgi:hypothetical protein
MIYAAFAIGVSVGAIVAGFVSMCLIGSYLWQSFRDWIDSETRPN